ncbi:MAG TPA: IclR family transcriptional regulator [Candidatus Galloscillospira excrementavium]|nr:IclR family transcriptional regulator [Candidatus Galloscillospira excrementavium]
MREAGISNQKYLNQSIVKAAAVLDLFTLEQYELGISTIAAQLDMPVSTTHRILNTLESVGYISQNAENGKYRLGLKCFVLGNRVRLYNELASVAKPYLTELSQRYNETTNLSVGTGTDEILCISKINANRSFFATPNVGGTRKIQITACGKCILAFQTPTEQKHIISQIKFERFTPNTIVTEQQLREQLEVIRRDGYAMENEEGEMGLFCCGAPVFSGRGDVCSGAVSISMPVNRVPASLDILIADVKNTARQISRELGYIEM